MSLLNELILERDMALKNGDFVEYSKMCLIIATITIQDEKWEKKYLTQKRRYDMIIIVRERKNACKRASKRGKRWKN